MNIRTTLLTLTLFLGSSSSSLLHAGSAWPDQSCGDNPYWITFSEMEFCIAKRDIEHLNHLNLSSPSMQITFKSGETILPELLVNALDASKATGGLHTQFDLTVKEFFLGGFSKRIDGEDNAELFRSVMTIDANTILHHFSNSDIDAFVILREPDLWDDVYILNDEREVIIQLAGEFNVSQIEWLLARLRWRD